MATFPSKETFILSLLSFLVISMFLKWILFSLRTKKNLPPSPPKLPLIGNLHQLGSIPHRSLRALSRKYGPLMYVQLGNVGTLVASSAEVAQEIMKTHDLLFSSRPNLTIPNILLYDCNDIAFSRYGEYWRQLKAIVVIHLLNSTRVKSYQQVREEEMRISIGGLGKSHGSLVDLSALFASLSKNIICRIAFGGTHNGSKFTELFRDLTEVIGVFSVGNYISWLSWVDELSGINKKAKEIAKEFDEFLENILEEHVNKRNTTDAKSDEGKDLVDILLEVQSDKTTGFTLERDSLKAVILDVFGGGIDNTTTTLEWATSELIKNPRIMKRLQQEVTEIAQGRSMISEEDLEKMKYLKAVIKETLRLHVPLPLLLPRESTQDVKLMGYDIPAGTQVLINAWAIGTDPAIWDEPMEFRPERFLTNSVDYKGLHFELLPFGAGRRRCPGIQFGEVILELAIANMVYKFDLALPNGVRNEDLDMSEACGITVHKKSSLLVMLSAR